MDIDFDFEPVMVAQLARFQAAATLPFTADATLNSAVLTGVSDLAGLFAGLPAFGPGVPRGAVIQALDAGAGTVTLSLPMTAAGSAVAFTTGFLTIGRRAEHWSKVAAQPALFFRCMGLTDEYDHDSFLARITLECEVWIYANAGKDPDAVPDTALSNLEKLVRASFVGDGDYGDPKCTLGGLVYWSRIEGRTDRSPGDQGPQAISKIPVRITLPQ